MKRGRWLVSALLLFGATPALAQTPGAPSPAPSPAEAEYERRFVGFTKIPVFVFKQTAKGYEYEQASGSWGEPYQGRESRPLVGEALYQALERPDLAMRYRQRARTRRSLLGAGTSILAAGIITAVAGIVAGAVPPFCRAQDLKGVCIDADASPNWPATGMGIGLSLTGLAVLIAGAARERAPVPMPERAAIAREHNRRLREQLGLPPRRDDDVPDEAGHPPIVPPPPPSQLPPPPPPEREPRRPSFAP